MKKAVLILVALLTLFSSLSLGEEIHGVLCDPEQNSLAEIRIRQSEGSCQIYTDLLPGWVFQTEIGNTPVFSDEYGKSLRAAFQRWTALMNLQEVRGLFAADLIPCATIKKHADLSWGDLITLCDLFAYNAEPAPAGMLRLAEAVKKRLILAAENNPELRFRADLFEAEKAVSVSVVRGQDTVGTFSLRSESDTAFHMVIGSAENGRTYYREIRAEYPGKQDMSINLRAYADDQGAGFGRMNETDLLSDENIMISGLGTERIHLQAEFSLGPEQSAGGSLTADVKKNQDGTFALEAGLFTGKNRDTEAIRILVDQAASAQTDWPAEARYYDLMNPDEQLTEELKQDIAERTGEWFTLLLKVIPLDSFL